MEQLAQWIYTQSSTTIMTLTGFTAVGFIGLGAMGKHMAEHLANKLPQESQIYVYDVVNTVMDELAAKYPGKITAGTSPRNVAENTVCFFFYSLWTNRVFTSRNSSSPWSLKAPTSRLYS